MSTVYTELVWACVRMNWNVYRLRHREILRGVDPSRGGPVHNLFYFFPKTFICAFRVCVPISVANGQKTWPPNVNTHTDRQFELYILD